VSMCLYEDECLSIFLEITFIFISFDIYDNSESPSKESNQIFKEFIVLDLILN